MKQKIAYYLRTSHYLQQIGTQEDKIEPGWAIYKDEGISGRIEFENRPAAKRLLQDLRDGKISELRTMRLERLGRSVKDLVNTITTIHSYSVPIHFIAEGITTLDKDGKQTPTTGLLINTLISLSEFFYHQNREKTLDGIKRAVALNKYKGRVQGSTEKLSDFMVKPQVIKVKTLLKEGVGIRKICRTLDCSANFVYKVKAKMLETA
jgi:DNA invertase Pin-like site-specific DNA recombinase